jgi:hypothetical protein
MPTRRRDRGKVIVKTERWGHNAMAEEAYEMLANPPADANFSYI